MSSEKKQHTTRKEYQPVFLKLRASVLVTLVLLFLIGAGSVFLGDPPDHDLAQHPAAAANRSYDEAEPAED